MSRCVDLDQIEFLKVDGNKEFNHGVDCCINILLEAEPIEVVSLDKIKKAREEIENNKNTTSMIDSAEFYNNGLDTALAILDKLIESEG